MNKDYTIFNKDWTRAHPIAIFLIVVCIITIITRGWIRELTTSILIILLIVIGSLVYNEIKNI